MYYIVRAHVLCPDVFMNMKREKRMMLLVGDGGLFVFM